MRVCKHGCDVKMFCFSSANHASTNLKKFSSSKRVKLETWKIVTKKVCQFFFRLSGHFKREKSVFWKASFWKTRTDYARTYASKTSWTRLCD